MSRSLHQRLDRVEKLRLNPKAPYLVSESELQNRTAMKFALELPSDPSSAASILAAAARFHAELLRDVVEDDADCN